MDNVISLAEGDYLARKGPLRDATKHVVGNYTRSSAAALLMGLRWAGAC